MRADTRPSRREVVAIGLGALVVAVVPVAARRGPRLVRRTLPVMGTIAEIVASGLRTDRAEAAIDAAMRELTAVDLTMSRFRPESDIGRVNREAHLHPIVVSAATAEVVREGLRWAAASDGGFDPAIGRVVELWDVNHHDAPPPDERVHRLAGRHFHHLVEVGTERGAPAIAFSSDEVHLDLGGIAKGWGVDRAAAVLRDRGVTSALVDVGGDLVAIGASPDGSPWRVGVRDPDDPRGIATTLDATDCAIATSGDYEQFFRYRGTRYHHLMDPATASPARRGLHSATVRAARCLDADAGATTAFTLSPMDAARALATRGADLVASA